MTLSQRRPRRWIRRLAPAGMSTKGAAVLVALVVLFAMPLVVFATRSLVSAGAVGVALLLGGFLAAVTLYLWAALSLLQTGSNGAAGR